MKMRCVLKRLERWELTGAHERAIVVNGAGQLFKWERKAPDGCRAEGV